MRCRCSARANRSITAWHSQHASRIIVDVEEVTASLVDYFKELTIWTDPRTQIKVVPPFHSFRVLQTPPIRCYATVTINVFLRIA